MAAKWSTRHRQKHSGAQQTPRSTAASLRLFSFRSLRARLAAVFSLRGAGGGPRVKSSGGAPGGLRAPRGQLRF